MVEKIGIELAILRAESAVLRIFLLAEDDIPLISPREGDLLVRGKSDISSGEGLSVSGTTGAGIDALVIEITRILLGKAGGAGVMTRERHRIAMKTAQGAMESARNEVLHGSERAEMAAEDLRTAVRALEALVGRVDVEHLLDEIFSSFCIGK
jgi:tRNA modification GTPase